MVTETTVEGLFNNDIIVREAFKHRLYKVMYTNDIGVTVEVLYIRKTNQVFNDGKPVYDIRAKGFSHSVFFASGNEKLTIEKR